MVPFGPTSRGRRLRIGALKGFQAGGPTISSEFGALPQGQTSIVERLDSGVIRKRLKKNDERSREIFDNEIHWLSELEPTGLVPKLLKVDYETLSFEMEYAGVPISNENAPRNWRLQVQSFLNELRKHDCSHNDLTEDEVLVDQNGILRFIDFGSASTLDSVGVSPTSPKKLRVLADDHVLNLLRLLLTTEFNSAEPHCIVLWDSAQRSEVIEEIEQRFSIIQEVLYSPKALRTRGRGRRRTLTEFYGGRASHHGNKGRTPFIVFLVFDENPTYGRRANSYNGVSSTVNTNIFDFKVHLRQGRHGFLHGSDTMQEAFDNFSALSTYPKKSAVRYFNVWRKQHESLDSLLDALRNNSGLDFTILRGGPTSIESPASAGGDIDILVNDYLLFKRLSGSVAYKHKIWKLRMGYGLPPEYGGTKVACSALIGGSETFFDVRYVGDGYMDKRWQEDILLRASKNANNEIDPEDLFFATAYHVLYHKQSIPQKYFDYLSEGCSRREAPESFSLKPRLFGLLQAYMQQESYSPSRPLELSIPFQGFQQIDLTTRSEFARANLAISAGRFDESLARLRSLARYCEATKLTRLLAATKSVLVLILWLANLLDTNARLLIADSQENFTAKRGERRLERQGG